MFFRALAASILGLIAILLYLYQPFLREQVSFLSSLLPINSAPGNKHTDAFNPHYHLGGNGPWVPRLSGPSYSSQRLTINCKIDQAHLLSRHAERYPTSNAGARHLAFLSKLSSPDVKLNESLAFLRNWTYFTDPVNPSFEDLTESGPYAGTEQAKKTGELLRQRYNHLIRNDTTTNFWTCSSSRDVETARWFAKGFFGPDWDAGTTANLQVIPETAERGADTLTPGDTCLNYINEKTSGHDQGYAHLTAWQSIFTAPIAARLRLYASGIAFTPLEIYSMMELCGFEILARGASP
ncbi:hypothetical protein LTR66_014561, partial [Elasticomyces elasticus]